MGGGRVRTQIDLVTGELVPGGHVVVRFRVTSDETLRVRGAHVRFEGRVETRAVYTTSDGDSTYTQTATERTALFEAERTFRGRAPEGFFANLVDAARTVVGGGDHELLEPGLHEVLLPVDLPPELPESVSAERITIAYEASVHLDLPLARDVRGTVAFPVARVPDRDPAAEPVLLRWPEDSGRGVFDSLFGPDVALRVTLDAAEVRRGGTLRGAVEVLSDGRPPVVDAVVCRLVRREQTRAGSHEDRVDTVVATARRERRGATSGAVFERFELGIPEDAAPTCSGARFDLAYVLAVALDVPWAKDPTARIPVRVR